MHSNSMGIRECGCLYLVSISYLQLVMRVEAKLMCFLKGNRAHHGDVAPNLWWAIKDSKCVAIYNY